MHNKTQRMEQPIIIKKAWEIGIGATGLQMTRFNVINFHTNNKGGYTVGTNKKDLFLEEIYILLVNLTLIFI
jgi:hypothetical protein